MSTGVRYTAWQLNDRAARDIRLMHGELSRTHAGVAMQIAEFGMLSQAIVYRRSRLSTG